MHFISHVSLKQLHYIKHTRISQVRFSGSATKVPKLFIILFKTKKKIQSSWALDDKTSYTKLWRDVLPFSR